MFLENVTGSHSLRMLKSLLGVGLSLYCGWTIVLQTWTRIRDKEVGTTIKKTKNFYPGPCLTVGPGEVMFPEQHPADGGAAVSRCQDLAVRDQSSATKWFARELGRDEANLDCKKFTRSSSFNVIRMVFTCQGYSLDSVSTPPTILWTVLACDL